MAPTSSEKRLYLMTGGNVGIGFEAAKLLLSTQTNIHLILACRDAGRAEKGVDALKKVTLESNVVEYQLLDLASFANVHQFSTGFIQQHEQRGIHCLILNAGLMALSRKVTVDGHEANLQVNHLSQYLLVQLLLPLLRQGHKTWPEEKQRIVFVSSALHIPGVGKGKGPDLRIENIEATEEFDGMVTYRNSKLAQMMCMYVLNDQLQANGAGAHISVNALSPGFVPTTDLKRDLGFASRLMMDNIVSRIAAASTVEDAGRRLFAMITDPQWAERSGAYCANDEVGESSEESKDAAKQQFWSKWTLETVGLASATE